MKHPVFISEAITNDATRSWPRQFLGEGNPGRVLRASSDVIDLALSIYRRGHS